MALPTGQNRWRDVVEECFRREAGSQSKIPGAAEDLIDTGALDSMGWVSFLRTLESATGVNDIGSSLADGTPSFENIYAALDNSRVRGSVAGSEFHERLPLTEGAVCILGSGVAFGSRRIPSEQVDAAFGMPVGKLRRRAGIESLAYAADGEDEVAMAAKAAEGALRAAACGAQELDWIIATSETHDSYPSLAAKLHSHILARETCGALDVGGGCLGLVNGLAVAQGFLASGQARAILVATVDVHSRILVPGRVPGEFGGLFGDGASAFLLRLQPDWELQGAYRFGRFLFGCAGQYAGAIRVARGAEGKLDLHFDGEALSRAAITRLEKVIFDLEARSGIPRSSLQGLATHQPNPRLVSLLAKQCGLSEDKFPAVAKLRGNLGSSTCGVALHSILESALTAESSQRGVIFLASLGPGLLFGGGWFIPKQ
jgi:3-oxoacyl-[acyl-carrier-protein] synthase III